MIPYFTLTSVKLGPITLQVWGTFVALGIVAGAVASARYARRFGTSKELIYEGAFWLVLSAFIGARLMHVFVYEPGFYLQQPAEIIAVWHGGFSMFGGLLGAAGAYIVWTRRRGLSMLTMADQLIYGLPLGLGCGRMGCFLVHDHPGTLTHFILGVRYPDGTVRHDHGLYLSLNGFAMALVFYLLSRKPRSSGFFTRIFMIWYGAIRFFLDFFRTLDARYAGLTPAQYLSIVLIAAGILWVGKSRFEAVN